MRRQAAPTPTDEAVLDDVDRMTAGDAGDLLRLAASAARQVRVAWTRAAEAGVSTLAPAGRPRAVVVSAVGSSAVAAGMLAAVAGPTSPVPVIGHHTFGLPGWVGAADVVMVVSASGESGPSLSAAEEADRRGARMVVVGAPGTPLAYLAARAHAPFVPLDPVRADDGPRPARSLMWSLAIPLVAAGRALGFVREGDDAVEAAAARLEEMATRCRPSSESFVNPAKMLALESSGCLPVLWGTTPVAAVAAERAASQLAANAKYPAVVGALPHPADEQVAAFDGVFGAHAQAAPGAIGDTAVGADFFRDRVDDDEAAVRLRVLLFRDQAEEHPLVGRQAAAAAVIAAERGIGVTELVAQGRSRLERLASLIGLVDYASLYLAFVLGLDPWHSPAAHDLAAAAQPRPLPG